jgi:hypothetical protein
VVAGAAARVLVVDDSALVRAVSAPTAT